MFNILLDELPSEYEGYEIRTNFTIGMKISLALSDYSLSEKERYLVALSLLYYEVPADAELAVKGLQWFLDGGSKTSNSGVSQEEQEDSDEDVEEDNSDSSSENRAFDFEIDASLIYSAFKRYYPNIDLKQVHMHWFEFLYLLRDLGECAFTKVIDYRTADLKNLSKDQKKFYLKMRKEYELPPSPDVIAKNKILYGSKWKEKGGFLDKWYVDII